MKLSEIKVGRIYFLQEVGQASKSTIRQIAKVVSISGNMAEVHVLNEDGRLDHANATAHHFAREARQNEYEAFISAAVANIRTKFSSPPEEEKTPEM